MEFEDLGSLGIFSGGELANFCESDMLRQNSPEARVFEKSGMLLYQGHKDVWKRKWVAIRGNSLQLHKTPTDRPSKVIALTDFRSQRTPDIVIDRTLGKRPGFVVILEQGPKTQILFAAETAAEADDWLEVLQFIEMRNVSSLPRGPPTLQESLENQVLDEMYFLIEKKDEIASKYGEATFQEYMRTVQAKYNDMAVVIAPPTAS